ncbi:MAG: hypothetical protein ABR520_09060, partial [Mycobacteriales bacterium]
ATARGMYVAAPGAQRLLDITPGGAVPGELAMTTAGPLPSVFGMTRNAILRRQLKANEQVARPPLLPPVNLKGGRVANVGNSRLLPARTTVRLLPGQSKLVRYTLDLAPTPTPLDVFFETDSTGSMQPVIAGLRRDFQDIINDLAKSGINVYFGVADFKDYETFGSPGDYPYALRRKVGPVDEELKDAIERIPIGGGNGLDSSLTAAYQAATGEGQARVESPVGPVDAAGWWIEPGRGADFRTESLKVIVLAQDVRSRDPQSEPGYPGPSYDTVIRTLNRDGIKVVGLAVGNNGDGNNGDGPRRTLEPLARGTDTLSPDEGTDCDGDGDIDIAAGQPLVCSLRPNRGGSTSVAPAMVSLLRSVQDLAPIDLAAAGNPRVVRIVSPAEISDVNVKAHNLLHYTVRFTCDRTTAGATYPVTLQASTQVTPLATATADVECGEAPAPRPAVARALPLAAAAIAPPAPPPVEPNLNPQPNPNPQVQPNTQAQLNAAIAQQEQEEVAPQLAYVDTGDDAVEELAMSRRDDAGAGPAVTLAAGLMASVAAGVALHRQRTRVACAFVRSR